VRSKNINNKVDIQKVKLARGPLMFVGRMVALPLAIQHAKRVLAHQRPTFCAHRKPRLLAAKQPGPPPDVRHASAMNGRKAHGR
jgi:hypothetical protein